MSEFDSATVVMTGAYSASLAVVPIVLHWTGSEHFEMSTPVVESTAVLPGGPAFTLGPCSPHPTVGTVATLTFVGSKIEWHGLFHSKAVVNLTMGLYNEVGGVRFDAGQQTLAVNLRCAALHKSIFARALDAIVGASAFLVSALVHLIHAILSLPARLLKTAGAR